jgi:hypothetical protein
MKEIPSENEHSLDGQRKPCANNQLSDSVIKNEF